VAWVWRGPSTTGNGFDEDEGVLPAERARKDVGTVFGKVLGREDRIEGIEGFRGSVWGEDQLELPEKGAVGRAPEAIVPDLVEAFDRHVLKETPDELKGRQRHDTPLGRVGVLIAEGDLAVVDGDQPAVGDSNTMDVSSQIGQDRVGVSLDGAGPYAPLLFPGTRRHGDIRKMLAQQILEDGLEDHG
jgi:hypothetical protein